ncbi:MAG: hypothetical protein J6Y89_05920 [Lachnospiraceae bacterium]|nr:hypothetical protein [Lachnospiraceae bacterium]
MMSDEAYVSLMAAVVRKAFEDLKTVTAAIKRNPEKYPISCAGYYCIQNFEELKDVRENIIRELKSDYMRSFMDLDVDYLIKEIMRGEDEGISATDREV